MAKVSVREAARRYDVSRPTLAKHIKEGKISAERQGGEGWLIDTAELARVYSPRAGAGGQGGKVEPVKLSSAAAPLPGDVAMRIAELEKALALAEAGKLAAEALAEERARHIEDLRRMLPAPDAAPGTRKRGWWPW
jgi:excisionase family DNA binding protein